MNTVTSTAEVQAERRSKYHEADVVVVGAGVFGCGIAYALAKQGRSVLLLERWMKEPDRIVGELMQPGGIAALKKLGLEKTLQGIDSIPCHGYNVFYHDINVLIPYPAVDQSTGKLTQGEPDKKNEGVQRPQGCAFHHGRFIMNLRRACLEQPNITVVETEVTATIKGEHTSQVLGVEARTYNLDTGHKEPDFFFGTLTIIADGYASKFRQSYLGSAPIVKSKFYALELIDCKLPEQGFGTVIIGKAPSPILLYQIGSHETRCLIDVPIGLPEAAPAAGGVRGYIRNTVLPTLPKSVQPSVLAALDKDDKIPRSMPNSWLPAVKQMPRGMLILGDALNMRHPLTGGGMTVAFNDVVILADLLSPEKVPNLGDEARVQRAFSEFHWRRKSFTSIINVLAQALYSLFAAADNPQLRALQKGCFGYFQRGITDGPAGLLGGLIHQPFVLFRHFFAVAFLAIGIDACRVMSGPAGFLKFPLVLVNTFLILWKACVVFLPVFWKELK